MSSTTRSRKRLSKGARVLGNLHLGRFCRVHDSGPETAFWEVASVFRASDGVTVHYRFLWGTIGEIKKVNGRLAGHTNGTFINFPETGLGLGSPRRISQYVLAPCGLAVLRRLSYLWATGHALPR